MATTQVAPGVELTHPSSVRVDVLRAAALPTGWPGMRRTRASPDETPALPTGLADSGLSVTADIALMPPRGSMRPMRALEDTAPSVLVDLSFGEGAVVLVQANGVYTWVQADEAPPVPLLRRSRRQVRFTIAAPPVLPTGAPAPPRRGIVADWLADAVVDQIRVTVFKYL